ncbi:hypothetical protein F5Y17DRAFT_431237 [Xylariaceae sp. FL0594]|nr:hypothetical protein F5Y17DRAFT_431237 [Xylariaceae sp. FL0594]
MQKLLSTAVAGLALASSAYAVPNPVEPRATDAALEPWVTVNADGEPATITPVLSTISGTPTIISGAPHDLTAEVFTYTSYGKVITTTSSAPLATPTGTGDNQAGAFSRCHNLDGANAPWCLPKIDEPLYVGRRYYFTWDPEFFSATPNATVRIVANYLNSTTGEPEPGIAAFESSTLLASSGFWTQPITDEYLRHQGSKNLTIILTSSVKGKEQQALSPIKVTTVPGPTANGRGKTPDAAALYIALPTVLGFIALCVLGTCLWNRHHRRIQLGGRSVMGRNYDVSGSSRFGLKKKKKNKNKMSANERIQLMEREIEAEGGAVYRDLPDPAANRPRRDSDALGSLAGTPTRDRRMDFDEFDVAGRTPAPAPSGNAFRDELRRQADER